MMNCFTGLVRDWMTTNTTSLKSVPYIAIFPPGWMGLVLLDASPTPVTTGPMQLPARHVAMSVPGVEQAVPSGIGMQLAPVESGQLQAPQVTGMQPAGGVLTDQEHGNPQPL